MKKYETFLEVINLWTYLISQGDATLPWNMGNTWDL